MDGCLPFPINLRLLVFLGSCPGGDRAGFGKVPALPCSVGSTLGAVQHGAVGRVGRRQSHSVPQSGAGFVYTCHVADVRMRRALRGVMLQLVFELRTPGAYVLSRVGDRLETVRSLCPVMPGRVHCLGLCPFG